MPHSWKAYKLAKNIADLLHESGIIADKDLLMTRGIIQIEIEADG